MASFKILKGISEKIPTELHEGYAYFTTDEGNLYIDISDTERVQVNAKSAKTLSGLTATVAELNKLDGVTATTAEINKLDGLTATTAELNYVDGVTSNIQTQLNSKVNASDIVNNLTTNVSNKPLSAAQGVALKALTDTLQSKVDAVEAKATANEAVIIESFETKTEEIKLKVSTLPEGYPYVKPPVGLVCVNDTFEGFTDEDGLGIYEGSTTTPPFEEGKEYTVTWDGTDYMCIAFEVLGQIMLGNGAFYYEQWYSDTGEPFLIYINITDGIIFIWTSDNISTSHTVKIVEGIIEVVKMDEKYLPKLVGKDVSGQEFTLSDGTTIVAGNGAEVFNGYTINIASGNYSHAEGGSTTASGVTSHAEGESTTASGYASHSEGYYTTASGDYSHAEGNNTEASEDGSHAEGGSTTASGNYSHAEGEDTTASGYCSHAEGYGTEASGVASHTEGESTTASEYGSHAEGYLTTASGYTSHSEGENTIASGDHQHVQGKHNIEDTENKYAHIVGNGTYSARSNAHTLDWNGNAWYQGAVYVGGTSQDDAAIAVTSDVPMHFGINANGGLTITYDDGTVTV